VTAELLAAARDVLARHVITDLQDGGMVYVDALALDRLREAVREHDNELSAGGNSAVTKDGLRPGDGRQWCPVCKLYHRHVGERTDAGHTTRPCPLLPANDPRNYS
jgi:hypothetical protein